MMGVDINVGYLVSSSQECVDGQDGIVYVTKSLGVSPAGVVKASHRVENHVGIFIGNKVDPGCSG